MNPLKLEQFTNIKRKAANFLKANRPIILLSALCFATSLIFSLNELPTGSDIPSHYIKIINMRDMLTEGKFVRWSNDWYSGYAMFDIYPPLIYMVTAVVSLAVNDVGLAMKLLTIASFSSLPILLYRLGRALGRTPKGATYMALLFSLTPLNIFFLFNGYFILIPSLALMFIFLTEFFNYIQKRDKTSFLYSTAMLAIISFTYHRALYFILLIILLYVILKLYRKQVREAINVAFMSIVGVGVSAYWLLPATLNMLSLQPAELYQSLILVASNSGVSFYAISILFIVPYCYLAYRKVRKKGVRNEPDLLLLTALIFFVALALGPYGPLYYVLPFSSSQRVEVTLLMVTFIATALASSLFDEGVTIVKRASDGILLSSLFFLAVIVGIFFYPRATLSLDAVNFTYAKGDLDDSLANLISSAYVEQQVFLGKNDEEFLMVLQYIANDPREGRVAFYSNRSQTVSMFYYYALLPLSGKSTPQGIAPEGEGDTKWVSYTQHIIWRPDEALLKLSGTRWVISNSPLILSGDHSYKTFGQYRLYELDGAEMLSGGEGTIHIGIGETRIVLSQEYRNIVFAESYHPRWRAYDESGRELRVESTEYGFMRITSADSFREIRLIYSNTTADTLGGIISVACLILFAILFLLWRKSPVGIVGNDSV